MFPQQNWIKSIQKSYRLHDNGPQFLSRDPGQKPTGQSVYSVQAFLHSFSKKSHI